MLDIAEDIDYIILHNPMGFDNGTLKKLKEGALTIRKAHIYTELIDALLQGEDTQSTFLQKLERELQPFKK